MSLTELSRHTGQWLRSGGPAGEVVISSRVRLARNLAGLPFLGRSTRSHQRELEQRLWLEILDSGVLGEGGFYVDVNAAGQLDRELLVERHLISRHHADDDCPRGVAISADETVAIMVNEEDHIRMQVFRNGQQLDVAAARINAIDDKLDERLDFAFHGRYGYLTACPTNVGTGLRVSVMLHLPALTLSGAIDKALRAAGDMHLAIRGLHGEGTAATGDFFQLSNQTTLGKTEQQIVEEFTDEVLPSFIDYELSARDGLSRSQQALIDDRIFRAMATLKAARVMSTREMMSLLSMVRLGVNIGKIDDVSLDTVNDMFLLAQPAHLQKILGRTMTPDERAAARADYIHKRLGVK